MTGIFQKKGIKVNFRFHNEMYVLIMFHTQININCKKCIIVVVLIFSQSKPMPVPKTLENAPALILTQLHHCESPYDITWLIRKPSKWKHKGKTIEETLVSVIACKTSCIWSCQSCGTRWTNLLSVLSFAKVFLHKIGKNAICE